jgi:hypothetical protein
MSDSAANAICATFCSRTDYYTAMRTYLSLNKDAPAGNIVRRPILGELHHQFGRM